TAEAVAERTPEGGGDHLLGSALRVVARLGAVHDSTTGHVRRADRALTGVTRALLLEGLAAGTGDLAATLVWVRSLVCGSVLRDHERVDQASVGLDVEGRGGQLDGACFMGVDREVIERDGRVSDVQAPLPALRTKTMRPRAPGTAPSA